MTGEHGKLDSSTLERALMLACERIADGPQSYGEANTPDGWFDVFVNRATSSEDSRPAEPLKM